MATKKAKKTKFQRELKEAQEIGDENNISALWVGEFRKIHPTINIISPQPFRTDGILKAKVPYTDSDGILNFTNIHTLLEFKNKKGFKNKRIRCSVLMQALFYLHNIREAKQPIPSTIFIGDGSECFFLNSSVLEDYLNKTEYIDTITAKDETKKKHIIDWSKSPSTAAENNIPVLNEMEKDPKLDDTFIVDVQSATFRVKDIFPILEEFTRNYGKTIKITENNLFSAFQYFKDSVLTSKEITLSSFDNTDEKEEVRRLIDVFYDLITDKRTTIYNKETGCILNRGKEVSGVDAKQYKAFIKMFEQDIYTQSEKEKLVSVKDQVLEEMSRRMTGAYFTPDLWIKKAHEMVSEQFGKNWKDTYTVWDCASGTNNLTCQYPFKDLYNSTLEQGDVNTVKTMGYPGQTFQYDFLNDDESKLPEGLKKALVEKKPILFLINPPYGTSGSKVADGKNNKTGISTKTIMNVAMKADGIGSCADQLYAQFLYRIMRLKQEYESTNIKICIFSPPLFLSSESYTTFRETFYKHFTFKDGMLFQADQFADVSEGWGISFTIWEGKPCN